MEIPETPEVAFFARRLPPLEWDLPFTMIDEYEKHDARAPRAPVHLVDKSGEIVPKLPHVQLARLAGFMIEEHDLLIDCTRDLGFIDPVNLNRFYMHAVAWFRSCFQNSQPALVRKLSKDQPCISRYTPILGHVKPTSPLGKNTSRL